MKRWLAVLLGLTTICCDSDVTRISVSPDSAATEREGVVITVRSLKREGFGSSHMIRFGGRALPTDVQPDGSLQARLDRTDLRMTAADPESKDVQVAIAATGNNDTVSEPTTFRIRKAFRFSAPSTIASAGSYPAEPLDRCTIQRAGLHTFLVTWLSSSPSPGLWGIRSDDDGASWSRPALLYQVDRRQDPFVAATSSGSLLLFFLRDDQLLAVTSPNLGTTWTSPAVIAQRATSFAARLDSRGHLDLAWVELRGEGAPVRYSRSNDSGATWTPTEWVAEDWDYGWVDGIVGDSAGRALLCKSYDYGRYGGSRCYRRLSGARDWQENNYGPTSDSIDIVHDDGTLFQAGESMYAPYMYSAYVSSSADWGTTWSGYSFYDEYGDSALVAFLYGGGGSFSVAIRSEGETVILRSHDRAVSWEGETSLNVHPLAFATTSDGAILGVGGGAEGIWLVRGD